MTAGAVIGTIAIVAGAIAVGVVIVRKAVPRAAELRDGRPRREFAAGDAPATAIPARAARIARLRRHQRCAACRARATADPDSDTRVHYGERELLVIHPRCPKCGATRAVYIAPR